MPSIYPPLWVIHNHVQFSIELSKKAISRFGLAFSIIFWLPGYPHETENPQYISERFYESLFNENTAGRINKTYYLSKRFPSVTQKFWF